MQKKEIKATLQKLREVLEKILPSKVVDLVMNVMTMFASSASNPKSRSQKESISRSSSADKLFGQFSNKKGFDTLSEILEIAVKIWRRITNGTQPQ